MHMLSCGKTENSLFFGTTCSVGKQFNDVVELSVPRPLGQMSYGEMESQLHLTDFELVNVQPQKSDLIMTEDDAGDGRESRLWLGRKNVVLLSALCLFGQLCRANG